MSCSLKKKGLYLQKVLDYSTTKWQLYFSYPELRGQPRIGIIKTHKSTNLCNAAKNPIGCKKYGVFVNFHKFSFIPSLKLVI